jgi:hypothetical protein
MTHSLWEHEDGTSYLMGIPAPAYFTEQISRSSIVDSEAQKKEMKVAPGSMLRQEGFTNDASTFINRARKNAGCGVSDKVLVRINCGEEVGWALVFNLQRLMRNTNAVDFEFNVPEGDLSWDAFDCGEKSLPYPIKINVEVV